MPAPSKTIASIQNKFFHGSQVAGTSDPVALTSLDIQTDIGVLVKAASTNTGLVYIGNADVTILSDQTTDGFELAAGEAITIELDQANEIFAIASVEGQAIFWLAL